MCLAVSHSPHPARVNRVTRAAWERRILVGNIVNRNWVGKRGSTSAIRQQHSGGKTVRVQDGMFSFQLDGTFELSALNPIWTGLMRFEAARRKTLAGT